ncbi:hypothetical protein F4695_004334 [Rhizobium soli]|uniref:Initiator Rep protein WH1 domain-containing protein n=1 Tax=Rhizobium soli TaxID=424798 RepID=A0A7X0JQA2_9HYPH|nr:RepB family plasmid replication initiator protein [Rhizobium soli]MBB6510942.1 hypothetical protein [Rhizobium soli]
MPVSDNRFFHRRTRAKKNVLTGADRRGYQGSREAMTDYFTGVEQPRVERAAVMIRTMKFIRSGEHKAPAAGMTAKSHALYEFLMASARIELSEKELFSVTVADAKAYLGIQHCGRLREYVEAINNTEVTYDFRIKGYARSQPVPLLSCSFETDEKTDEQRIAYSMPSPVRDVILKSRQYAMLEINAFRNFSCKYTARLYPRLALLAGMDIRKSLVYRPEELAEQLGWVWTGKFHFGNFFNRVMKPVLEDLRHVYRFRVSYDVKQGSGRGSPIAEIVLSVTRATKKLREYPKATISDFELQFIRAYDLHIPPRIRPSEDLLRHAASKTGLEALDIQNRWKDAYKRIAANPDAPIGRSGTVTGHYILLALAGPRGVGEAFETWIEDYEPPILVAGQTAIVDADDVAAPVIYAPSPRSRSRIELAKEEAERVLHALNGFDPSGAYRPKFPISAFYFESYCDPDIPIWAWIDASQNVAAALGVLAQAELDTLKIHLRRMMSAIATQDFAKVEEIACEILSEARLAPARPRFPKRQGNSSIIGNDEAIACNSGCVDLESADALGH